jgi:hypothetical protein
MYKGTSNARRSARRLADMALAKDMGVVERAGTGKACKAGRLECVKQQHIRGALSAGAVLVRDAWLQNHRS